jgi:hypothetical protein
MREAKVAIDWEWQDALDRTFDQLTDLTFAGVEEFTLDHIREAVTAAFTTGAEYEIEKAHRGARMAYRVRTHDSMGKVFGALFEAKESLGLLVEVGYRWDGPEAVYHPETGRRWWIESAG